MPSYHQNILIRFVNEVLVTQIINILQKNRQEIPCYWETQPLGCLKPHCAFRHQLPRDAMTRLRAGKKLQLDGSRNILRDTSFS